MLPLYECHKKVRAGKIIGIIRHHNDANYLAEIMTIDGSSRQVDRDWMAGNPAVATGGYYVVYEDGYTAFSPAKAFEEGYNLVPEVAADPNNAMCGLSFGHAVSALKDGRKVARAGWNGKGMFVVYQKGYPDGIPCNKQTAEAWGISEGDVFRCEPYLQIQMVNGSHSMWQPSINDTLADDWTIVK